MPVRDVGIEETDDTMLNTSRCALRQPFGPLSFTRALTTSSFSTAAVKEILYALAYLRSLARGIVLSWVGDDAVTGEQV